MLTVKLRHKAYINITMLLRVVGWLLMIESAFMAIPCLVAWFTPGESPLPFMLSMGIAAGAGALMTLLKPRSRDMGKREAILLTGFTWIILSLFGMLPFLLYGTHLTVTDAFFETISGFTTTGMSVLETLKCVPDCILVWRCVTQWIGGLGIILFTLAVVPMLNTSGGMQMFNAEVTGITHDKLRPRVSYTAKGLWMVYVILTVLLIGLLWCSEMDFIDALCYGLSTMSTGGYSTTDEGIHSLETVYVKVVMTVFMFMGGVNFSLIYTSFHGRVKELMRNTVLKVYLWIILIATLLFVLDQLYTGMVGNWEDLTLDPLFQAVSLISSTGIAEPDFKDWGSLSVVVSVSLMFMGACAGSTSGGMKIDRGVILFKFLKNEFYKMMHPGAVTTVCINGKGTAAVIVNKTLAFLFVYMLVILVGGVLLSVMGESLSSGFFCSLQAISNSGLATDATNLAVDYAAIPDAGKWLLALIMLTGRLELFTVLLLFIPSFWKK